MQQINLSNLQAEVINSIISNNYRLHEGNTGEDYLKIEFNVEIHEIANLIEYFDCGPTFYFKNKDDSVEFLALGAWEKFTSLYQQEEIEVRTKKNPFIKIVGAQRFQQENCENEWHNINECYFFVPQVLIEKIGKKVVFCVYFPKEILRSNDVKKECLHSLATTLEPSLRSAYTPKNFPIGQREYPNLSTWTQMVNKSLDAIKNTPLKKVVLSRKKVVNFRTNIRAEKVFKKISETVKGSSYAVFLKITKQQSFMSFTPETLFLVKDGVLRLDSLAGTTSRGQDQFNDNHFAQALLSNGKELAEHRFVKNYIKEKMEGFVERVNIDKDEQILKLPHIQHIHSVLSGKLKDDVSTSEIMRSFHPTPAVGGWPKTEALKAIKEYEVYKRGLYAAPIGYFSRDNSEFAVAIRSALVSSNTLHIYGGCGIVAGSYANNEWVETNNKMKNFESYMGSNS